MNIQDLAVISEYKLPIGIFIFNNNGYLQLEILKKIISKVIFWNRTRSKTFFKFKKIASAYNVSYLKIKKLKILKN